MMTVHDNPTGFLRRKLSQPSGNLAHRNVNGAVDLSRRDLARLATIEQRALLALLKQLLDRANVDFQRQRLIGHYLVRWLSLIDTEHRHGPDTSIRRAGQMSNTVVHGAHFVKL